MNIKAIVQSFCAIELRQAQEAFTATPGVDNWARVIRAMLVYQQVNNATAEDWHRIGTGVSTVPISAWPDVIVQITCGAPLKRPC